MNVTLTQKPVLDIDLVFANFVDLVEFLDRCKQIFYFSDVSKQVAKNVVDDVVYAIVSTFEKNPHLQFTVNVGVGGHKQTMGEYMGGMIEKHKNSKEMKSLVDMTSDVFKRIGFDGMRILNSTFEIGYFVVVDNTDMKGDMYPNILRALVEGGPSFKTLRSTAPQKPVRSRTYRPAQPTYPAYPTYSSATASHKSNYVMTFTTMEEAKRCIQRLGLALRAQRGALTSGERYVVQQLYNDIVEMTRRPELMFPRNFVIKTRVTHARKNPKLVFKPYMSNNDIAHEIMKLCEK